MKKLIALPILALFAFIAFSDANAVVSVVDATGTAIGEFPAFNSGEVDTVSGNYEVGPGDYSLLFCSTESVPQDPNSFNPPAPNGWTELDNGTCGNSGCAGGIWGKFTDTAENVPTECSWEDAYFVFVGGTLRYEGVDRDDPIIDIACQSGVGPEAIAPSIVTEPGSHVVRAATYSNNGFQCPVQLEEITVGSLELCATAEIDNIEINAFSITDLEGGPTGEATLDLPLADTTWRACTIGIRMTKRNIPTMSEWGFIAVAAFMGAAGVWYLRRKQQTA